MDYTQEIFTKLQNGETVEDIAAELTKCINEANQKFKAEQEAKRKATAEAADKAAALQEKRDALEDFFDSVISVLTAWNADEEIINAFEEITEEDLDDIIKTVDEALPFITKYIELNKALQNIKKPEAECKRGKAPVGDKGYDPVIEFLDTFVRN